MICDGNVEGIEDWVDRFVTLSHLKAVQIVIDKVEHLNNIINVKHEKYLAGLDFCENISEEIAEWWNNFFIDEGIFLKHLLSLCSCGPRRSRGNDSS